MRKFELFSPKVRKTPENAAIISDYQIKLQSAAQLDKGFLAILAIWVSELGILNNEVFPSLSI